MHKIRLDSFDLTEVAERGSTKVSQTSGTLGLSPASPRTNPFIISGNLAINKRPASIPKYPTMRPIQTSGSCSTLVDVSENDSLKTLVVPPPTRLECRIGPDDGSTTLEQPREFVEPTHLYLPSQEDDDDLFYDDYSDDEDECRDSPWMKKSLSFGCTSQQRERLQLPASDGGEDIPLDKYLRTIPSVIERAEELQAQPVRVLSDKTTQESRILNICQGEIGHATSKQTDVIVSDRATTCHIVAVRSTSGDDAAGSSEPLVSLCHIDKAGYKECIRNMIQTHKDHHGELSLDAIDMDIHLVGGYDDGEGTSLAITEHLLHLLGQISTEEKDDITMTLKTCAVSGLNDSGFGAPIGRGLAMDTATGTVYLASVDDTVAGPAPTLRAARLWSTAPRTKLSVVHTQFSRDSIISIEPFEFSTFKTLDAILSLPDHIMLQYTSTSPDVEEDDFCHRVRTTLRYIRSHQPEDVFGPEMNQPVQYSH